MNFNLKYLILPLSIMVCINNNCINAMEDINENQNKVIENNTKFQRKMLPYEMSKAMRGILSIIQQKPLNDKQIDFIQRIAYAASSEVPSDIKEWKTIQFVGWYYAFLDDSGVRSFNNLHILAQLSQYDIYKEYIGSIIHEEGYVIEEDRDGLFYHDDREQCNFCGKCNRCTESYIYFLKQIKECYNQNYINKNQYTNLLKFLLYCNTNRLFHALLEDNVEYKENILKNLRGEGEVNINKSKHPILDCFKPYITFASKYKNITNTITKIQNELIEVLLPAKITLSNIKQFTKQIRPKILEIIAQGIYDSTRKFYEFNDESERFEVVEPEYAEIFNTNSKEFLSEIDTEFNITVLTTALQTKKLLDEQKDQVQINKMIKDLLNDYISRSINENNIGNIIDELNTGKIVDPEMFSEDQDEDKSLEYKPVINVIIKKAIKELINNFIQNEETKSLSELTLGKKKLTLDKRKLTLEEKRKLILDNRRKKMFMSLINSLKQNIIDSLVKNNIILNNPKKERYNSSKFDYFPPYAEYLKSLPEYIIKQTSDGFDINNLQLAKKFGILECFEELIEEDTRNGTNNIPDEWKEVYSDFIASGGYL